MKACILNIDEAVLCGAEPNECSEYISSQIFSKGGVVEEQQILKFDEQKINDFLSRQKDVDFVFVLCEDNMTSYQKTKEIISAFCKDELVDNSFAQNAVDNYYNSFSLRRDKFYTKAGQIPRNAKCIINKFSRFQGFYSEYDDKTYFFLPSNLTSIKYMMEDTISSLISNKFKNLHKNTIYKLFGLTKEQTLSKIEDLLSNKNKIKVNIYQNGLEQTIKIEYSNYSPIEDVNAFIAELINRLGANIFAVEDLSIYEIAFYLLKANKATLAVAESITGGNITANLIKYNSGISQYLKEGIVTYTNLSKINRLKLTEQFLDKYTDVSAETAYEMCAGLLETSKADICLSTCGYAELENTNAGYAFIAVGDNSGIHVFKTTVSGTREQVIEMITKSALFHLIKKLKK